MCSSDLIEPRTNRIAEVDWGRCDHAKGIGLPIPMHGPVAASLGKSKAEGNRDDEKGVVREIHRLVTTCGQLRRASARPSTEGTSGARRPFLFAKGWSYAALVRKAPRAPAAGDHVGTSVPLQRSPIGDSSRRGHGIVTGGVRIGRVRGSSSTRLVRAGAPTRPRSRRPLKPGRSGLLCAARRRAACNNALLGGDSRRGVRGIRSIRGRARKPCRLQKSTGGVRHAGSRGEATILVTRCVEPIPVRIGEGSPGRRKPAPRWQNREYGGGPLRRHLSREGAPVRGSCAL